MANFRIFVEKKDAFNIESKNLLANIRQSLNINISSLRVINTYDVFNITPDELEKAKYVVFAEPVVDLVMAQLENISGKWFAVEPIPGQYDQRADSATQALRLLGVSSEHLYVTTGKVIIVDNSVSESDLVKIQHYYLNPLETRLKDISILAHHEPIENHAPVPVYTGFIDFNTTQLQDFRAAHGLAMTYADLLCIQDYFKNTEKRNPSETEIKVLDTYWSDHCRHTTFETHLNKITFADGKFKTLFTEVFNHYSATRSRVHGDKLANKPITLMDLATICGKDMRNRGRLDDLEISDEINACSLVIDIKVNNQPQKWSLQFKNETHNHPTEIEPYGGASTCVGGAIRDPLSGRSYVYQAMRISGAANVLEKIDDTLIGKLPQSIITSKAAHGFSSYGNQIGLATTYVREIYHDGYKAKRMEVGMVVAAAPFENIRREKPIAGDVIILLGGRTGRDGCGGATGSSKEHDVNSASECSAEVQKGNPVVERKIQRLFRNKDVTLLIKKCNDFGAGGVSVAIGELASGVEINLDKVPTKYLGLTGTELAISESQERMAVIVAANDVDKFIHFADAENLEAVIVAKVTDNNRMTMYWQGNAIVDLARDFLDTNGAKSSAEVIVADVNAAYDGKLVNTSLSIADQFKQLVSNLNICSQQGLVDAFDATIGATTILMPFGGKYQLTPTQVSAQLLPVQDGDTTDCSIASFGYDADLSSYSQFHGAYYAVVDSVAKIVASGGNVDKIRFSFQEYFERLGNDPEKWGKPFIALLGAYHAQQGFELAAIGGKDSMSGTFNDLHVPPTLISFAVAHADASKVISPEFKQPNEAIYVYTPSKNLDDVLDLVCVKQDYATISQLISQGKVSSAYAVGKGGVAEAVFLMAIGNKIGASIQTNNLFAANYGSLIFASAEDLTLSNTVKIGTTTDAFILDVNDTKIDLDELIELWQAKLQPVFPLLSSVEIRPNLDVQVINKPCTAKPKFSVVKPRVIVPVFPGTNCEYDTLRAFNQAGAAANTFLFRNLTAQHIAESIIELTKQINNSQILMLPGGFSAGDEPDGSAKFIATILRNPSVRDAVHELLARDGLILGICNGFQALVKSGLLPYGEIKDLDDSAPTLTYNTIGRHISRIVPTKIASTMSPWVNSFNVGDIHNIAMSHGEGRFVISDSMTQSLAANGQIIAQYADVVGNTTMDVYFNPNGSDFAIESICSADGRILGKMGHSERKGANRYKNIPNCHEQDIFTNGVNYFK